MRRGLLILLTFLLIGCLLLFGFSSYPRPNEEDQKYIGKFMDEWKITRNLDSIHANFDAEVQFISQVQDSLIQSIISTPYPNELVGNVFSYYKNRKGICYDRAILLEKILTTSGFSFRHLYVFFRTDSTSTTKLDFFKKGLYSHALLEVKTQKGWMTVGTNANWLGLDTKNEPLKIVEIRNRLEDKSLALKKSATVGSTFYNDLARPANFRFVYGVFSRHGKFLQSPVETGLSKIGMGSFTPDYNLRMLFYNF